MPETDQSGIRTMRQCRSYFSTIFSVLLCAVLLSCEKYPSDSLDPKITPLALKNVIISPSVINTDTINIGPERKPDDVLPIRIIVAATRLSGSSAEVRYVLSKPEAGIRLSSGVLRDDGIEPDLTANDSVFTAAVRFEITRSDVSTLQMEVWPEDRSHNRGTGWLIPVRITRSNQAPLLSDLVAPDTMRIEGQTKSFVLQVKATDPDGPADIRRVFFNSFRPDGTPSSGNPFEMFDDGNANSSGDSRAGDGIYSLRVILPATATPGRYRFEFQAVDRSSAVSNTLIHFITVIP